MFGDSIHIIDYGRTDFGMDAERWIALQTFHGVVHAANRNKVHLVRVWIPRKHALQNDCKQANVPL